MPKLVIIRGLPASGKSTVAQTFVQQGYEHFEADNYFVVDGEYNFVPEELCVAHAYCQHNAFKAIENGKNVVVSNTFVKKWEYKPYLHFANLHEYEIEVLIAVGKPEWKNIHGVPEDVIQTMRENWEY